MGLLDGVLGSILGGGQEAPAAGAESGGSNRLLAALLPVVLGMVLNRQGEPTSAGSGGLGDLLGGLMGGGGAGGGLAGALASSLGGGQGGGLGGVLGGLLGGGSSAGGLGDLVAQFQRAGYGEQIASWVGSGQNQPISPEALAQVFGGDALARIAQHAGVSDAEASAGLAQLLPDVVDRLTPDGTTPDIDQLAASVAALTRQFGA